MTAKQPRTAIHNYFVTNEFSGNERASPGARSTGADILSVAARFASQPVFRICWTTRPQARINDSDKYRVARRVGLHAFRHGNTSVMDTDALLRARRDNHLSRRLPEVAAPLRVRQDRVGHVDADLTLGTHTHARSADRQAVAAKLGELLAPPELANMQPVNAQPA